jgi:hypothetical protein
MSPPRPRRPCNDARYCHRHDAGVGSHIRDCRRSLLPMLGPPVGAGGHALLADLILMPRQLTIDGTSVIGARGVLAHPTSPAKARTRLSQGSQT